MGLKVLRGEVQVRMRKLAIQELGLRGREEERKMRREEEEEGRGV